MIPGEDYEEYSPEFDVQVKVGSEMPSGRTYYMELAKELYAAKAIDLVTLWDVMETGKFPPKELIMERLQNRQPPPPGQPGGQPPMPPSGMEQLPPDMGQMPPGMGQPGMGQMPAVMERIPPQMGQPPGNIPELLQMLMNGAMGGGQ